MRRRWMILVVLAVLGFAAYALFTGGLTYVRLEDFGGQRNIRLVPGLKSDIALDGKTAATPMLMLSDVIKDIVTRHVDVKITLFGNLIRTTGEKINFQASDSFKAESRTQWGTWWEAIAGC